MAKLSVLDIMRTKMTTPAEFHFDSLMIPPMEYFLTQQDVQALHSIATSIKLSSNIKAKYKMIDDIMKPRGFKRFSAGTNRVVYNFLEDPTFVVKIAVDKVGMQDNPAEFQNQQLLKPYVSKMFYISSCGTVGFSERVLPVKNKEEFRQIASDVFDLLVFNILGKYVVEDVGTKYFMNYGVRAGFGPVLLDYPYVYKLDGKKLFCTGILPGTTNTLCDGEIDYDEGFNSLICTRCGKRYLACDLRDKSSDNKSINIKGGNKMKVNVMYGNQVIKETISTDEVMRRRQRAEEEVPRNLMSISVNVGTNTIYTSEDKNPILASKKTKEPELKKMNVSVNYGEATVSVEKEEIKEEPTKEETVVKPEVKEETAVTEEISENIPEEEDIDEGDEYYDDEEDGDYVVADSSIIDGLIDTSQNEEENDSSKNASYERRETNWTTETSNSKYNKHGNVSDKINK